MVDVILMYIRMMKKVFLMFWEYILKIKKYLMKRKRMI